jgi:hypothetical protein
MSDKDGMLEKPLPLWAKILCSILAIPFCLLMIGLGHLLVEGTKHEISVMFNAPRQPESVAKDVLEAWSKGDTAENYQNLLYDKDKAKSDSDRKKWPSRLYSPTDWDVKGVQLGVEDDLDHPVDVSYKYDDGERHNVYPKVQTAKVTVFVKSSNEAGMAIQQLWEFKLLKNKDGKWGFSRVDEKDKK